MNAAEAPRFMQLLAETLAAYGKPLPEAAMARAWLANLEPYPFRTVEAAMQAYRDENGEFAPVPAGIAMRCKLLDGRPGVEEAWAVALASRNEADTVVWTAECAEAFALCRPILGLGDEVGARMAFKEAYQRLVAQARAERRPALWSASVGWDAGGRDAVLGRAAAAGLLPAPVVQALLPAPTGSAPPDDKARAQLAKIKKMQADAAAAKEAARLAAIEQRRLEDIEFKRTTNDRVRQIDPAAELHTVDHRPMLHRIDSTGRHALNAPRRLHAHAPSKTN